MFASASPFFVGSGSGSMLEARRFKGDEERWGRSVSPFIMARLETRKGDWLLGWFSAEPASSTAASLSSDRSAYAEAQGDDAAEEAYSEETSEFGACWLPGCCRRAGKLESG